MLYLPPGLAHGFAVLGDHALMAYLTTSGTPRCSARPADQEHLVPHLLRRTRPSRWASSWREPNVPSPGWPRSPRAGRPAKLATLDTTRTRVRPCRKLPVQRVALGAGVPPVITGARGAADARELVEVLADDERWLRGVAVAGESSSGCRSCSGFARPPRYFAAGAGGVARSACARGGAGPADSCRRPLRSSPASPGSFHGTSAI